MKRNWLWCCRRIKEMFLYDVFPDVFSHKTSLPRYLTIQGRSSPNFTGVR